MGEGLINMLEGVNWGEARIEGAARDLAGEKFGEGLDEPLPRKQKIFENSYLKPCNLVYS